MRKELKVFIFVILTTFLFSQLVGDDNLNRVLFSVLIAKHNEIYFDRYENMIDDILRIDSHVITSKSPGLSFFLSPFTFLIEKIVPLNESSISLGRESIFIKSKYYITHLPKPLILDSLIAIFFFSSLPAAIIVLILNKYVKNIYLSLLLFLSTFLFSFSTTLFSYTFSIMLILFAFYKRHKIVSPLFLGLSVFVEFTSIFLALIVLYFIRKEVEIRYFLIGIMPTLVYLSNFHSLFIWYLGLTNVFPLLHYPELLIGENFRTSFSPFSFFDFLLFLFRNVIFILFSPYRSIFIFSPLLLIFFIYYNKFKDNTTKKIATFSFFVYLIFSSLQVIWWNSLSFGPRYMIYFIPFAIISIGKNKKVINRKLFYSILLLSLIVTFSSFQFWEGARRIKNFLITGIYKKGELVFYDELKLAFYPVLFNHYFRSFIENGPRSKLLESLFTERPFDLRFLLPEDRDYFSQFYFYIPYLPTLVLSFLTLILFYRDLKKLKMILILVSTLLITCDLFIFYSYLFVKDIEINIKYGFYKKDNFGNLIMSKEGIIFVYSSQNVNALFSFLAISHLEDRNATLSLNGNIVGSFKIGEYYPFTYYFFVNLRNGKNIFKITADDCIREIDRNISENKLCISLILKNITIIPLEKVQDKILFSEGWYLKEKEDEYRWGTDKVRLILISSKDKNITFYFDVLPIFENTTIVKFYLNGELKNIFEIAKGGGWVYTLPQKIKSGVNILEFTVDNGCIIIDNILHNGDKRCFAMTLRGLEVVDNENNSTQLFLFS
jgi:hypothetical protein